jgi:soluble lytic murein transglycosylase-like protein
MRTPAQPYARAAAPARLSPALVEAVALTESGGNDAARSPKGAIGAMQLMPATARALNVDATDPEQNLAGGARYLRLMLQRFDGDLTLALAAYNAGPEAVRKYRGIPPFAETRAYVARVLERLAQTVDPVQENRK